MEATPTVRLAADEHQYELWLGADRIGIATVTLFTGVAGEKVLTVQHVETDPAHRGRGHAAMLMAGLVDDARARSLKIRPRCPYAVAYMGDRPETHDLYA